MQLNINYRLYFLKLFYARQLFYLHLEMKWTYLALGDSYTIGEGVLLPESFPYQTVQLLRQNTSLSHKFTAPEIVAKTGWTTDELIASVQQTTLLDQYDFVSLLIGVNNQYRGKEIEVYKPEFRILLQKAIALAGDQSNHVFVLSIPDWGVTPFADSRDRQQIAQEIDAYNAVCKTETQTLGCTYIDITTAQRANGTETTYLAGDGLHPSGKEYEKWAMQLSEKIKATLNL